MRYVMMFVLLLLSGNVQAQQERQIQSQAYNQQMRNYAEPQNNILQKNPRKNMRRKLNTVFGNQKKALDLLVLQEVASYKLNDENLKKDVEDIRNNEEYYRKLEIIRGKLSNGKFPDSLNKEILRILDDTGNRLYKLLGN